MTRRSIGLLAAALLAALALQLADIRLAAAQTTTLVARRAPEVPTNDPWDAIWSRTGSVQLPLSAQLVVAPKGGSRESVRLRAMYDDARLYVLLEWTDATPDRTIGSVTAYTDAAALQFPAASTTTVPPLCMGSPTAIVNIWQWKAAWQEDATTDFTRIASAYPRVAVDPYPFDPYPFGGDPVYAPARDLGNLAAKPDRASPVENLHAGQYGTLTTAAAQPVRGTGTWRGGTWRVLIYRDLAVPDEGDVRFAAGDAVDAAVALWDGGAAERSGMKAVSAFFTLRLTDAGIWAPQLPLFPWLLLAPLASALLIGGLIALGRTQRAPG